MAGGQINGPERAEPSGRGACFVGEWAAPGPLALVGNRFLLSLYSSLRGLVYYIFDLVLVQVLQVRLLN